MLLQPRLNVVQGYFIVFQSFKSEGESNPMPNAVESVMSIFLFTLGTVIIPISFNNISNWVEKTIFKLLMLRNFNYIMLVKILASACCTIWRNRQEIPCRVHESYTAVTRVVRGHRDRLGRGAKDEPPLHWQDPLCHLRHGG